jgi:hypothetical protein
MAGLLTKRAFRQKWRHLHLAVCGLGPPTALPHAPIRPVILVTALCRAWCQLKPSLGQKREVLAMSKIVYPLTYIVWQLVPVYIAVGVTLALIGAASTQPLDPCGF